MRRISSSGAIAETAAEGGDAGAACRAAPDPDVISSPTITNSAARDMTNSLL
jgi:hypothetical protein